MLMKTHLVIGAFAVVFFLPYVSHKLIFVPVVLIASLLPDIDSGFSTLGRRKIFRPLQFLTKHRGIIHSFTFCIAVSVLLAFYFPLIAFPFFLGYALHLLADSWTIEGIRPFWPLKDISRGKIRVGGTMEETVFIVFIILDAIFLIFLFI
ncbi:MAG: metal-dependent hydrolase [Nanoarchaeota archaeon]|nr:metal-dependent hydrolase [Nanoarchaeota archaeon]